MICPQCGTENAPGDKFCEQCGTPLSAPGPNTVDDAAATMVGGPPASAMLVRTDDPGQTFPLGSRVVVGRLDTCDIPIHDKSVSREHARLSQLPGGYVVEDLGSTNGTLVNGEPITEAVILRPGDSVTFGSIEFQFEEERAPLSEASAASTQPFQYRPPTATEQEEVAPAATESAPAFEPQTESFESPVPEPAGAPDQGAPAFEFPPLQPFPAGAEAVTSNNDFSSVEPAQAEPEPVASVGSAQPVPSPDTVSAPEAGQMSTPEPQAPPISPIPPTPGTMPTQDVAPTAIVQTAPSMSGASADDVIAAAAHLNNLVQSLAEQTTQAEARLAASDARIQELETRVARGDEIAAALRDVPAGATDDAQIESMRQVLDQLAQNPRDIELLMQVGRHAGNLASALGEYEQMRQTLQRVRSAANS